MSQASKIVIGPGFVLGPVGVFRAEPSVPKYLETLYTDANEAREGDCAYAETAHLYEYRGQRVVAIFRASMWGCELVDVEREDGGLLFRDAEFLRGWFEDHAKRGVL